MLKVAIQFCVPSICHNVSFHVGQIAGPEMETKRSDLFAYDTLTLLFEVLTNNYFH